VIGHVPTVAEDDSAYITFQDPADARILEVQRGRRHAIRGVLPWSAILLG